MDLKIFERLESEVRGYIRSFPVVFKQARGSTLIDETGREYVDFFAGAGTLNYGHNNPYFKEKLIEYVQSDGIVHGLDMATSAKACFMATFEKVVLKPRSMRYTMQFTGPTGTNAVEAALKLARQVKGRPTVISFTHGFHGLSGGSLSVTANSKYREAAGTSLDDTVFMPYDGYMGDDVDTIAYLEKMLEDSSSGVDKPAAVIVETVQGEGGVNVASMRWLRELQRVCREHDMLLIVDDIQAGCGRTGTFFSFEPAGIQPDIITLSKSLSGYGLPMSLVLMKPEHDIWQPGAHTGTFRGNNLAFVTATEALEKYWTSQAFTSDVQRKERILREFLENIVAVYPDAGLSVRGRGLMQGLVSEDTEFAGKVSAKAFEQGLVIETSGANDEVLKFLPALTITEDELRRGLEIVERAVAELMAADGHEAQTQRGARVLKFGSR